MKELSKREMIDQMYSLRAGLSAISVEKDNIDNLTAQCEQSITDEVESCARNNDYYGLGTKVISIKGGSSEQNIRTDINYCKGKTAKALFSLLFNLILFIGLVVIIILAIKGAFADDYSGGIHSLFIWLSIVGSPILIAGIIYAIFGIKFSIENIKENIEKIHGAKRFLSELPKLEDYINRVSAHTRQVVSQKLEACEFLYDKINSIYSPYIDVRDWKYTDFVIFYYETGRVDSLKEALQLVDREVQTDRIISTIEQATKQICETLRQGFRELGRAINNLSEQIRLSSSVQSAQMSNLLKSVNLNNALLAKQNVTSEQIMNDINQLRTNSDYVAMRKRNSL